MEVKALDTFGRALRAYHQGQEHAEMVVRRDDGMGSPLPVGVFFRDESQFSTMEWMAVALCQGGCGTSAPARACKAWCCSAKDVW